MSVSCWSPAAPPCWEPLRIDGAIKTPSKETHTVTEGSRNIDNYSVHGLWSSRGRERGRTWGRRKQGERDWWWCISMHGGTAICSLRLHKNTNMKRRNGARRGENKTDGRNEGQKINGCVLFFLSLLLPIDLLVSGDESSTTAAHKHKHFNLSCIFRGEQSVAVSIDISTCHFSCQPVLLFWKGSAGSEC